MSRPVFFHGLSSRHALHAALVLCVLALAACKGGEGEAQAKPGDAPKAPDAVPVEVVKAATRPVEASYTGTEITRERLPLTTCGEGQRHIQLLTLALDQQVDFFIRQSSNLVNQLLPVSQRLIIQGQ